MIKQTYHYSCQIDKLGQQADMTGPTEEHGLDCKNLENFSSHPFCLFFTLYISIYAPESVNRTKFLKNSKNVYQNFAI
jgi:hypothetical protein